MTYKPGLYDLLRALKDTLESTVDPTPIPRRSWITTPFELLGFGALVYAGKSAHDHIQQQRADNQQRTALQDLATTIHNTTDTPLASAHQALINLTYNHQTAQSITKNQTNTITTPTTLEQLHDALQNPTILTGNDPLLHPIFATISPARQARIKAQAHYLIFAPTVTRTLHYITETVDGMVISAGSIAIATQHDGTGKDPRHYAATLAHETRHEEYRHEQAARRQPVYLLYTEREAINEELACLDEQIGIINTQEREHLINSFTGYHGTSTLLDARDSATQRLTTATFLSDNRFNQAFNNVYPKNVILSQELLQAQLTPQALTTIINNPPSIDDEYAELYHAANATHTTLNQPRATAIRTHYQALQQHNPDPFTAINALYSLAYLAPHTFTITTTRTSHHPRGNSIDIIPTGTTIEALYDTKEYHDLIPDPQDAANQQAFNAQQQATARADRERAQREGRRTVTYDHDAWERRSRFMAFGKLPPLETLLNG